MSSSSTTAPSSSSTTANISQQEQQLNSSFKNDNKNSNSNLPRVIKSVVPKLAQCTLDQTWLRRIAQEELNLLLSSIIGSKTLVLDPSLIGPLALIIPLSVLINKMGVSKQIYRLDGETLIPRDHLSTIENLVVLTRPKLQYMKILSRMLQFLNNNYEEEMKRIKVHLFFLPRRTLLCEIFLEKSAVYHMFSRIGEYGLDLIPFDSNLLFLELPYCNRELMLEGDTSSLYFLARSLIKLQSCYGIIPSVKWFGKYGEQTWRMMRDMGKKIERSAVGQNLQKMASEIDELILFDRQVDLVSCLVTGLTYESLVDQLYGLKNNLITMEQIVEQESKDNKTPPIQKKEIVKIPLNDDDQVFREIRHLNFLSVGQQLNKIAHEIEAKREERKSLKEVKEIRKYSQQLPELLQKHNDLANHLKIASKIKEMTLTHDFRKMIEVEQSLILQEDEKTCMEYIESCIIRQDPLDKVLRLLCLMSITKNGLSQREFDHFKTELVISYGHYILITLDNLQRAGLLTRNSGRSNWKNVRNGHNLMIRDIDEKKRDDIAYVHSGYAPLSIRLIQKSQNSNSWAQLQSNKSLFLQSNVPVGGEFQKRVSSDIAATTRKKRILCAFIGGITKCEVSALRSLENNQLEFIIISTNVNGEKLVSGLFEQL
jgi:hypothetical protein